MADNSPPEGGTDGAGSDNTDLPANQDNHSAEEQHETVSHETEHSTEGAPREGSPQPRSNDNEDAELAKFAESRGYGNWADLSERERALVKDVRENQRAARKTPQKKAGEDLRKVENDIYRPQVSDDDDEYTRREAARDAQMAQLLASQRKRDFFDEYPDAKELESDMAQLIAEEKERYGVEAARFLANDLRRVYVLAKENRASSDADARIEAARREERELLRQKQEAGSGTPAATQSQTKTKKLTGADIRDMPEAEYKKLRDSGELDKMIARGDLY